MGQGVFVRVGRDLGVLELVEADGGTDFLES
jgi:hypothetical protein